MAKINIEEEIKKFKLIDAHAHFGKMPNVLYYNYSNERIMELQTRFNIETSILSHSIAIYDDLDAQIEEILKAQEKFGKSIYWQLVYRVKQSEKSFEVIEKYKSKINFAGIKMFTPSERLFLDSRQYYRLWEYAVANDIVVAPHTWSPYTENPVQFYANPLLLESVLKDFPKLKILLVHSGGKADFYDEVIDFTAKHDTVYMETSGDCFHPPVFKKAINKLGKGRIMFGTDMPMMDVRYHISNVIAADISDSDKEDIFYNNAKELFKL